MNRTFLLNHFIGPLYWANFTVVGFQNHAKTKIIFFRMLVVQQLLTKQNMQLICIKDKILKSEGDTKNVQLKKYRKKMCHIADVFSLVW